MKKLFSFLSLFLILFLLAACVQPTEPEPISSAAPSEHISEQSTPGKEESDAASEPSAEESTPSEEESQAVSDQSEDDTSEPAGEPAAVKNIVFIGNSLTNCGGMPSHLRRIGNGRYNVTNACIDGATLQTHIDRISDEKYYHRKALSEADIVVFQEFGGYSDKVDELLNGLMKLCKEICKSDTKYYFMMFEFFVKYPEEGLREECLSILSKYGIEPLPLGEITPYIRDTYFSESEFVLADGYHPTQLQGNMMAMAFIIIEEDESRTDGNWAGSGSLLNQTYPDKSEAEINEEMKKIQKDAYDHYQKVKSNYFG